jgi:hypothetical protein
MPACGVWLLSFLCMPPPALSPSRALTYRHARRPVIQAHDHRRRAGFVLALAYSSSIDRLSRCAMDATATRARMLLVLARGKRFSSSAPRGGPLRHGAHGSVCSSADACSSSSSAHVTRGPLLRSGFPRPLVAGQDGVRRRSVVNRDPCRPRPAVWGPGRGSWPAAAAYGGRMYVDELQMTMMSGVVANPAGVGAPSKRSSCVRGGHHAFQHWLHP